MNPPTMHAGLRGLRFPHARRALACLAAIALAPASLLAVEDPAVTAINQFGLSCQKLTTGNSLISPWSLQQCLGMAYAGAGGETRRAMAKALSYPGEDARLFAGFAALNALPLETGEGEKRQTGFKEANRIYFDEKLKLKDDWRTLVRKDFAAEPLQLKFSEPRVAERTINDWVNGLTDRRIPAVIPENRLQSTTMMVLVNALSFSLTWEEQFDKALTENGDFVVGPGKNKTIPFMATRRKLRYAAREGFQIAALAYTGKTFQFVVIVPDKADGLAAMEAKLNTRLLAECVTLPETDARLSIPRLRMAPPIAPMKETLTKLGMGVAFTDNADFRLMSNTQLKIDDVFHRTFIEVDESGTKAAAATGAVFVTKGGGGGPRVPEVRADRPFVFLIQDLRNGACLFIGRAVDPDSPPAKE